jgi:hypothetical protein
MQKHKQTVTPTRIRLYPYQNLELCHKNDRPKRQSIEPATSGLRFQFNVLPTELPGIMNVCVQIMADLCITVVSVTCFCIMGMFLFLEPMISFGETKLAAFASL